jgi:hypothetical protein
MFVSTAAFPVITFVSMGHQVERGGRAGTAGIRVNATESTTYIYFNIDKCELSLYCLGPSYFYF